MQEAAHTTKIDEIIHSFYVVKGSDGKYFAGFNPEQGAVRQVDTPLAAKWFSNRFDIRLRPNETLVEIKVDPSVGVVHVSEPFRPRKRVAKSHSST
jgi:hypothetical protein